MNKPLNWFEIPALDVSRARAFYQQILDITMRQEFFGPTEIAVFPYDRETATGGCVLKGDGYLPSAGGAVLYLNAGDALDAVLERVGEAGGTIALGKTQLPPGMGAFAHVIDTEGNRVGLHGTS